MSASGNGGKLRAKSESGAGPNNNTDSQRGSSSRWLATFHRAECPLSGVKRKTSTRSEHFAF